MDIKLLSSKMEKRWDDYVSRHNQGTPFHLIAWRNAISQNYPYKANYLFAYENDRICGVFPLFGVEIFGFKKTLLSLPFAVYGGPLTDSSEVLYCFRNYLLDLGITGKYKYIEIRNFSQEQYFGFMRGSDYVTFRINDLQKERDVLSQLPQKTRNLIRKSERSNFQYRICNSITEDFLDLMTLTFKRHGTPYFPNSHFIAIKKEFDNKIDIREIIYKNKVIAASLNIFFNDQMHCYYAGSDPHFWSYAPNVYMYYQHICWAKDNGFKVFEFGRSKRNTGAYNFKKKWGAEIYTLPYEIYSPQNGNLVDYWKRGSNLELAMTIWRRLPLLLTKKLGPKVVVFFP